MKRSFVFKLVVGSVAGLMLLVFALFIPGQASPSGQAGVLWHDLDGRDLPRAAERAVQVRAGRLLTLDLAAMQALLQLAPPEDAANRAAQRIVLELPMPDGSNQRFEVFESPIMAPELAARYPQIKTYAGQGLDDPTASTRLDVTPQGFHAILFTPRGTIYIDPAFKGNITIYVSYHREDYLLREGDVFSEPQVVRLADELQNSIPQVEIPNQPTVPTGTELRTYRLALAATGEYTTYHGGTVEKALAAQVVAMNRVNGIYEREVAIRMVLVPDNYRIIYTNWETDPYTNDDGGKMLLENQKNLDLVIGSANYDIGHVFSTGGGGIAMLESPCKANSKAQGVTGLRNPIGDAFYVDYVAHEMGHQWGGNHTYNGDGGYCLGGRNASTAYEPGSGSTIMGYAGICGDQDLQEHSDAYFHPISYDEIVAYTTLDTGNTCAVKTATGNLPPVINSGTGGYTIPINTPFTLSGTASDPDGDALTYAWDEMDLGQAGPPPPLDGYVVPPYFRSFKPTIEPSRTFPQMYDIVNNTITKGEILPLVNRTMNFRFTVRDNQAGGGGVNHNTYTINVTDTAGPFLVTEPNTALTWPAGSPQSVNWFVAGTDQAPVSCTAVQIALSIDGGYTYPITLLESTANDGSETITVPNIPSVSTARVRVACLNQIFFDISNSDIRIMSSPDLVVQKSHVGSLLPGENLTYTLEISNIGWLATTGTITVTDTLPVGLHAITLDGTGWDCTLNTLTCTRMDPLPEGSSFPVITLVADAALDVPNAVVNFVTVEGGGDAFIGNNTDFDLAGDWRTLFLPVVHR